MTESEYDAVMLAWEVGALYRGKICVKPTRESTDVLTSTAFDQRMGLHEDMISLPVSRFVPLFSKWLLGNTE